MGSPLFLRDRVDQKALSLILKQTDKYVLTPPRNIKPMSGAGSNISPGLISGIGLIPPLYSSKNYEKIEIITIFCVK